MFPKESIPFQLVEVIYYASVWSIAFLCGTFQTLRLGKYRSCWHAIDCGVVSGFLAFAIVALVDGDLTGRVGNEFFYLAVAVVVGLTIDRSEQYTRLLFDLVVEKLGLPKLDQNDFHPQEKTCEKKDNKLDPLDDNVNTMGTLRHNHIEQQPRIEDTRAVDQEP